MGCTSDQISATARNLTGPVTVTDPAQATSRSFAEFMAAQGTFCWLDGEGGCSLFAPPVPNFVAWLDPTTLLIGWWDYAGLAGAWLEMESGGAVSLGTEVTGSITEQPLADGRALLHLNLRARNVLTWVTLGEDFISDPLLIGHRVEDILYAGKEPAPGRFSMDLQYITSAPGLPLQDLIKVFIFPGPDQEVISLTCNMSARGELHELAGYPEGTYGKATGVQVNVAIPPVPNPNWDTWPVAWIKLGPTG